MGYTLGKRSEGVTSINRKRRRGERVYGRDQGVPYLALSWIFEPFFEERQQSVSLSDVLDPQNRTLSLTVIKVDGS